MGKNNFFCRHQKNRHFGGNVDIKRVIAKKLFFFFFFFFFLWEMQLFLFSGLKISAFSLKCGYFASFLVTTKKRPFGQNVDIKRVITQKNEFFIVIPKVVLFFEYRIQN